MATSASSAPAALFAFACRIAGTSWDETLYNAPSAGAAKSRHFMQVREPWPDLKFTAVRARKIGPAQTSDEFRRTATARGFPTLCCGTRVQVMLPSGSYEGTIVGHNESANFEVLFGATSPCAAQVRNVHPGDIVVLP